MPIATKNILTQNTASVSCRSGRADAQDCVDRLLTLATIVARIWYARYVVWQHTKIFIIAIISRKSKATFRLSLLSNKEESLLRYRQCTMFSIYFYL